MSYNTYLINYHPQVVQNYIYIYKISLQSPKIINIKYYSGCRKLLKMPQLSKIMYFFIFCEFWTAYYIVRSIIFYFFSNFKQVTIAWVLVFCNFGQPTLVCGIFSIFDNLFLCFCNFWRILAILDNLRYAVIFINLFGLMYFNDI